MKHSLNALQTRGLCKRLGGRVVLRDVDLDIHRGQCVAVTGANGAGKTTLLRCLAGLARPTSGQVSWFGRQPGKSTAGRQLAGIVLQESCLYPCLSPLENLLFAGRMWGVSAPRQRARDLLQQAGLGDVADRQVGQLSRGMQQRLTLVRGLVHDPLILLLDEPFSALDRDGRRWLGGLLQKLKNRGRTICLASHDDQVIRNIADSSVRLRAGRLHRADVDAANAASLTSTRPEAA
jgi:heme ABC exporter ATP-binding subunit CcmA